MKLIQDLQELAADNTVERVALTIGNYDGVHTGHLTILDAMKRTCPREHEKIVVLTFVPHPRLFFHPQKNFLINTYQERRELLEKKGVDFLLELAFNKELCCLAPEDFLRKLIFVSPKLGHLFIGHDFCFGKSKAGNFQLLKHYSRERGIQLVVKDQYGTASGMRVSSTDIRQDIMRGHTEGANKPLGRPFFIRGLVVRGEGRGRALGYPTANLECDPLRLLPGSGIYRTESICAGKRFLSATSIGRNPTFGDGASLKVESHLLDFDQDIYGQELEVVFHQKLRDEKKFQGASELISQIQHDLDEIRDYSH